MEPLLCHDAVAMRTRAGNLSPLSAISPPEDEEELRLIMQEVADALGASAIILTIQEDDQVEYTVLRILDKARNGLLLDRLHSIGAFIYDEAASDAHRWKNLTIEGTTVDIMILPVKRTAGHRRMVLSALFSSLDEQRRSLAERVYQSRRPFAVGYFRIWQIDRTRQSRELALEAALNSFGVGFVLIDQNANTVFVNTVALKLLQSGNGLRLDGNRIHATHLADAVRLRTALEHVTTSGVREAPMLAIARSSAPPLTLLALPLEWGKSEIQSAAAVIYIVEPAVSISAVLEPLCQIYQLTPSETKLTCLLATGKTLGDCAERIKIKEQTARSVLKQIFRKTGTTRQSELIILLFSSIIRISNSTRIEAISYYT